MYVCIYGSTLLRFRGLPRFRQASLFGLQSGADKARREATCEGLVYTHVQKQSLGNVLDSLTLKSISPKFQRDSGGLEAEVLDAAMVLEGFGTA